MVTAPSHPERSPQKAQDAVGQGAEQEPEPEGQPVRGGDAAEGDRQDEPEDGGNHAHRPAVTLLPLAPLVLLVTQTPGRIFTRLPRALMSMLLDFAISFR